ncbi:MAG: hypothetical protein KatS3mg015_2198 [Fimbriimonadales bacterium]|nr:MAG: hypothetical protein KatS3mg015_2198 [Fimbriimonadales bacterium]
MNCSHVIGVMCSSFICLALTGCGLERQVPEATEGTAAPTARRIETAQGKYRAVITLRSYQPEVDAGLWFGGSESTPAEVVQRIEIWYDGEPVVILRGAYSDLAAVNDASIRLLADGAELTIRGGDAADGYRAYLRFRNDQLVFRRVENGEFPEYFYSETHYVNEEPPG